MSENVTDHVNKTYAQIDPFPQAIRTRTAALIDSYILEFGYCYGDRESRSFSVVQQPQDFRTYLPTFQACLPRTSRLFMIDRDILIMILGKDQKGTIWTSEGEKDVEGWEGLG